MSELDENALEAAIAAYDDCWEFASGGPGELERIARECIAAAIAAYLAAAARPTPDAEAWVPMSDDDVAAMTARIKSGEADADEQARFAMTNMMFIIHQWASGAVDATSQQAYAAALLHHAESVNALYRKAVSR